MSFSQIGNGYDENIRRVIPYYDEIHAQTLDLITEFAAGKPISLLDTGCGSGTFAARAAEVLRLSELVICDPLSEMLDAAREKLQGKTAEFRLIGSEQLAETGRFDVVTAVQSHHYFDRETRKIAVQNCFRALKPGGLLIVFENTRADTDTGQRILLQRIERYGIAHGRTPEEVRHHSERCGTEYFPLTIGEHLMLLRETGFETAELFWHTYMQSGFYAIKGDL